MKKLRCIIVEDEPLAMERLQDYVRRTPALELEASFYRAQEALTYLNTHQVDLVFADVHLPGMDGITLIEKAGKNSLVIFSTAHPAYAVEGFNLDATDYLLKPYDYARFELAVMKALRKKEADAKDLPESFLVKTEYRLERIWYRDLLYIEGKRDYRKIHTSKAAIMTLQTFRAFEESLDPSLVIRVHKSYMVSVERIARIEKDGLVIEGISIPVSDLYRINLKSILPLR
jgi:DNA-binding LytR/AlgR family response regulator